MDYICIGKIVNTHGIKGEIRILSSFEFKDKVFKKDMTIYIGKKKEKEVISTYRHHKNFEMITMNGYNNINQILKYKGLLVYIDKEDLVLNNDEFLDSDLINLKVIVNDEEKGIVTDIRVINEKNKLLVINYLDKEVLIPYKEVFVKNININKGIIELDPIEGMF